MAANSRSQTRCNMSESTIENTFLKRHGGNALRLGRNAAICWRYGYFSPDVVYEDRVARLVTPDSTWIDVGGGRGIFPGNPQLARAVAERCHLLVSVDPSTNVFHNPYAHERVCSSLEEYGTTHLFDLATMRMVAEHIEQPSQTIAALYWLLKPGSRVIVYTVNRWSPTSIAADRKSVV